TLREYAQYAHSVVTAEKAGLRLPRRAVFFGTAHNGDPATQLSAELLIGPLADTIREKKADWQVEHLPPADCRKARLEGLLGNGFTRPDRKTPEAIAPRDFLAALPRRLLGHPKGGALAVIGHVDRAWTYSFRWGEAGQQT